jgi:hypothetical protein
MSRTKATVSELYAGVGENNHGFEFRLCGAWDSPIPANPDQERMMAGRAHAKTVEVTASHVAHMSHPKVTA